MPEPRTELSVGTPSSSDTLGASTHSGVDLGAGQYASSEPIQGSASSESIVIIDFGSQYSRLIARRVREANVYCELIPHTAPWETVEPLNPKGVILSGGPASVYEDGAPLAPEWGYDSGLPVLGICYGMQAMVHQLGGRVAPGTHREYGYAELRDMTPGEQLFLDVSDSPQVWMSHGDNIVEMPEGFRALASTDNSPIAALGDGAGRLGLQFHPEVVHTPEGSRLIHNFLYGVCGCSGSWNAGSFVAESVAAIRRQVGDGKVICALSGGVDSAVAASLVHAAIGDQLTCVFVNNGLLRHGEPERVRDTFESYMEMNLVNVDATERFLGALRSVTDPETKRKIIGEEFINVFEEEASRLGQVDFLAQGTLYPDVIESYVPGDNVSAKIKSHHNVGGLPEHMRMDLVEPLRFLFKDEVRQVGLELGLPEQVVNRQPFPGPGLAIRIIGEVTHDALDTLRDADRIVMEEVEKNSLYNDLWQSFAVLTDSRSVGVTGDFRTYGNVIAIRAVSSDDAMTADWARIPHDVLARMSSRISNEVPGVNRVVYDITSKPPGTIEWE